MGKEMWSLGIKQRSWIQGLIERERESDRKACLHSLYKEETIMPQFLRLAVFYRRRDGRVIVCSVVKPASEVQSQKNPHDVCVKETAGRAGMAGMAGRA